MNPTSDHRVEGPWRHAIVAVDVRGRAVLGTPGTCYAAVLVGTASLLTLDDAGVVDSVEEIDAADAVGTANASTASRSPGGGNRT